MLLSTFVYFLFKHLLLLAQAVKVPESLLQLFDPFHLEYLQVLHVFYLLRVDHGEVGVCKLIFLFWRQVVFIRVLHCERRPPSFKVLRIWKPFQKVMGRSSHWVLRWKLFFVILRPQLGLLPMLALRCYDIRKGSNMRVLQCGLFLFIFALFLKFISDVLRVIQPLIDHFERASWFFW